MKRAAVTTGEHQAEQVRGTNRLSLCRPHRKPILNNKHTSAEGCYSVLDLAEATRWAVLVTPRAKGGFRQQAEEAVALMQAVLRESPDPATVTLQLCPSNIASGDCRRPDAARR